MFNAIVALMLVPNQAEALLEFLPHPEFAEQADSFDLQFVQRDSLLAIKTLTLLDEYRLQFE